MWKYHIYVGQHSEIKLHIEKKWPSRLRVKMIATSPKSQWFQIIFLGWKYSQLIAKSIHQNQLFWQSRHKLTPKSTCEHLWCITLSQYGSIVLNTLGQRQHGSHFADNIFKSFISNENVWIPTKNSLKCDKKSALFQVMVWYQTGDKPLNPTTKPTIKFLI